MSFTLEGTTDSLGLIGGPSRSCILRVSGLTRVAAMPGSLLGTEVRRVEDRELLVGEGTFVDNMRVDGVAHAVFVRSPFAHARSRGIDTSEAEQAPGVLAVYTSADLGTRALPSFANVNDQCPRAALAVDKVRYVGDPVALVVAETRAQAVDAAELVDVDYDELPVVADLEAAVADDAPLQFEALGTNVAARRRDKDRSDPFEGADHVVRVRMVNQRIATAPIEGNAVLVDPTGDRADRVGLDPAPPPGPRPARRDPRPGPRTRSASSRRTSAAPSAARPASAPTTAPWPCGRPRSAARSSGPRPAARRCSRCRAAARCSTPRWG